MRSQSSTRNAFRKRYAVPDLADRASPLPVFVSECDVGRVREVHLLARACRNIIPPSPSFRRLFLSSLTGSIDYTRLSCSKLSFSVITFNAMMNDMTRLILATALIIAAFSPIQPYNSLFPFSPDPSIPCSHFGSCPDSPSPDDTSHATEPPEPSPSFCFRPSAIIR